MSENSWLFQSVANENGQETGVRVMGCVMGLATGKNSSSELCGSGGLSVLFLLVTWNRPPKYVDCLYRIIYVDIY